MTIQQIYHLAVELGIKNDLRGRKEMKKVLQSAKDKFKRLNKEEQEEFDKEKFTNPYSDTRILVDKPGKQIKKVLVGIDMETPELMLAKQFGDIDLVISHHPNGVGLADLSDVMHLQADVLNLYGVPINIAEGVLYKRIDEVARKVNPINHNRAVDAARLLDIGYMCIHTPADNMVATFLKKKIEKEKPEYVRDVLSLLKNIPEYKQAIGFKAGPRLFAGSPDRRAGKIAITEITGGTEGSPQIYEKMTQAGIGTVIGMHMSEEHKREAEKAHINAIIAGHISSDSLGMNLFLDELEKRGLVVVPCSGLIRVRRFQKIARTKKRKK